MGSVWDFPFRLHRFCFIDKWRHFFNQILINGYSWGENSISLLKVKGAKFVDKIQESAYLYLFFKIVSIGFYLFLSNLIYFLLNGFCVFPYCVFILLCFMHFLGSNFGIKFSVRKRTTVRRQWWTQMSLFGIRHLSILLFNVPSCVIRHWRSVCVIMTDTVRMNCWARWWSNWQMPRWMMSLSGFCWRPETKLWANW